jgi:hypothetical protein
MAKPQYFYSEAETTHRRETALKRMLATPHKLHAPLKKKQRVKPKTSRVIRTKASKT